MTTLLYKNNAATTLQSGIPASSLTCVLAAGTGALFPNPTSGQTFYMTFLDASTKLINEIVQVTARSGDALTIARGQQGTTALTWAAGDIATQLWTMGDPNNFVQNDQLQAGTLLHAVGAGTVNSITATLPSGLTTVPDMFEFIVEASGANTGNVTLTLTLGTLAQTAYPIHKFGGSNLNAGDIPAAGYPIQLVYSATLGAYIMTNPASGTAGSISGGAANDLLVQTAPGTTGFITAPTVAGSVLTFLSGVIQWVTSAVVSFGPVGSPRSGAVNPQAGDYTAAMVGAVPAASLQPPYAQLANPGYIALPNTAPGNGFIVQGGSGTIGFNVATSITFPKQFPNGCSSVVASGNNQSAAIRVDSITQYGFVVQGDISYVSWIATGW